MASGTLHFAVKDASKHSFFDGAFGHESLVGGWQPHVYSFVSKAGSIAALRIDGVSYPISGAGRYPPRHRYGLLSEWIARRLGQRSGGQC